MPLLLPDRLSQLCAPAHWQAVDFISDLHLQASDMATVGLWRRYLQTDPSERADALFILGDLFEVWVGDDVLEDPGSFASGCATLLRAHSQHTPVYFMHGNRDFLLRPQAARTCGMQMLDDPTVLDSPLGRCLLSHGDALCLDDTDYLQFRAQVRDPAWQAAFLSRSLTERDHTVRAIREHSEARKQAHAHDPSHRADVDAAAARVWLERAQAHTLVHGHTHRPALHPLGHGLSRIVLSDWDAGSVPPRAQVLRLDATGFHRRTL